MIRNLNETQERILRAIAELTNKLGRAPTFREIAEHSHYHRNTINLNMPQLVAKGLVTWHERGKGHGTYAPTPGAFPEVDRAMAAHHAKALIPYLKDHPELAAKAAQIAEVLNG